MPFCNFLRTHIRRLRTSSEQKCTNGWTSYESSDTYAITSMDEVHQLDVSEPGINHQGRNDNETIAQIRRELRAAHEHPGIDAPTRPDIQGLVNAARVLIVHINTTSLLSSSERFEDALQMISELQNFAYHDTDHGGVQDIAQWCLRAYLQLLAQGHESSPRLLTGKTEASTYHSRIATLIPLRARPSMASPLTATPRAHPPSRRQFFQRYVE